MRQGSQCNIILHIHTQIIQNIHQLKFMEAKELCYYMIKLLYLIQVNPLQILEHNLLLPLLIKAFVEQLTSLQFISPHLYH